MPMYEYACRGCDHSFVARRSAEERDAAISCPSCGDGRVTRLLATFMIGASAASTSKAYDATAATTATRRSHGFGCPCCT